MKRLKIAIFTDSFVPLLDGIVVTTIALAKGLADKGHKVYIIAPNQKGIKEFSYKNIEVKRVPSIPAFFYPGFRCTSILNLKLLKYFRKNKIDIIHFQAPFTLGVQSILIAKILKKPLVGTFHTFFTDPQYLKHGIIGGSIKFIQKISWSYARSVYEKCNLITCPSESAKEELISHKFKKPIKVISNGIDFSEWNKKNLKRAKNNLNLGNDVLLFVGRIAYEKNLLYLLECFKLVLEKKKKVKLLIVGDGPQMKELKKDIRRLGLSDNIILTGKIEHSRLEESGIFKASKLFVTCSTTETQGIAVLEAQINGLVCIGLDATGTKDLIKNNYNGFLIKEGNKKEFAEKVIKLLDNRKLRLRMKKNTLNEIRKHDLKKVISIWEKTYDNLVNK